MKKIIYLLTAVIFIICAEIPSYARPQAALPLCNQKLFEEERIYEDFLRLHIRANSDSTEDQALKLKVRDSVLRYVGELFAPDKPSDKQEAVKIVRDALSAIKSVCEETLAENNSEYAVSVKLAYELFPYKSYENFFLPEGIYEALIIEIGEGTGSNWWCVVYPEVCLSGSAECSVTINTDLISEKYRIASDEKAENESTVVIKYDIWLVKFIKDIFGSGEKT